MFDVTDKPRVFGLPPGADFAQDLVLGLTLRMAGQSPEAMARVDLYVNTRRMQRRIETVFASLGAGFLPRIRLITDLADPLDRINLPKPVPALKRQLELAELVRKLIEADPGLAPRSAVYDLAESLGALLDEMQAEGVTPDDIAALDVTDQSGHWERAQRFLQIVTHYFDPDSDTPDAAAVNRLALRMKKKKKKKAFTLGRCPAPKSDHHRRVDRITRFRVSVDDGRSKIAPRRSDPPGIRL